jgi:hypothetical protein
MLGRGWLTGARTGWELRRLPDKPSRECRHPPRDLHAGGRARLLPPIQLPPPHPPPPAWYSQMRCAASYTAGSLSLSHSALGTIHSALTGPAPPPFTASASSPVAATRAACAALRMSIPACVACNGGVARATLLPSPASSLDTGILPTPGLAGKAARASTHTAGRGAARRPPRPAPPRCSRWCQRTGRPPGWAGFRRRQPPRAPRSPALPTSQPAPAPPSQGRGRWWGRGRLQRTGGGHPGQTPPHGSTPCRRPPLHTRPSSRRDWSSNGLQNSAIGPVLHSASPQTPGARKTPLAAAQAGALCTYHIFLGHGSSQLPSTTAASLSPALKTKPCCEKLQHSTPL